MNLFKFSSPPPPASPICIYTCPFLSPPSLSPLRGGPFFPCSWGPSLPLLARLGIAISFFSYPRSFSCCSSTLTSANMLESLPFVDTPDAGFLLVAHQRPWKSCLHWLPLSELLVTCWSAIPILSPVIYWVACHVTGTVLGAGIWQGTNRQTSLPSWACL